MYLRCKVGDLALVIHDEECCASNVGKLVRVAGPVLFNRRLKKNCWLIQPVKQELWACVSVSGVAYRRVITSPSNAEHPDDWLLPIDPLLWNLEEDTEIEKFKAKAGSTL